MVYAPALDLTTLFEVICTARAQHSQYGYITHAFAVS